ncbi:hypothetical protein KQI61_07970 [Anaerocolumna aminovalerica]|uniref:hypothetical protein n=1 Tax=Anaerocolumna aminovalerica TaxID=1527 RepID=UPI001C0F27FD|nr:hypothetical protein [Anaerocolumna aminovalerica]MBU5332133.1 hypothetical protein [Anaerocolumna aminovalerica]
MDIDNVENSFIKIGDLDLVNILQDNYKLLIDDSTNSDTKAAYVSVLRDYLINNIKPHIDKDTGSWFIGNKDTGITANGAEFRFKNPKIQYSISGTDNWIDIFDITILLPKIEIDEETLCWKINGIITDKTAVNARINSMNGNVSIIGTDGIVISNDVENNIIKISKTDTSDNGVPPADIPSKVIRASDGQLIIKWTDPSDLSADGVTYSVWSHTILVRKIGSYPVDETDGEVLVINNIRNQYAENGYVDSGLINGIKYYYKLFIYSEDGVVNRNPKNNMIGIPKKYFIYGVRIDETNSNPLTAVEYTDDAIGMEGGSDEWDLLPIFANIQPCLLKDGVVQYYLNKDNYYYKANGVDLSSIVDGNDGDVMIEIPKMAYLFYREGNYLYIKITNDPDAKFADERFCYYAHTRRNEGDRQNLYIGAYGGCVIDDKLRSLSDKTQSGGFLPNFRTQAKANGYGYDILSFYPLMLIQCLYLIKYKHLNCISVLGKGLSGNKTGLTNTKGFYNGVSGEKIKLFGIEDLWGNSHCWIDGIKATSDFKTILAFDNFNDTDNYIKNDIILYNGNITSARYISAVQGTNELGFLFKTLNGSATTYFTSLTILRTNSVLTLNTIFTLHLYYGGSDQRYMARLMYL